jgi:hypothetical protein
MAGLMDRLAAAKAKQGEVEQTKSAEEAKKQAELAEEQSRLAEQEARRGELSAERESVAAEVGLAEKDANEASQALQEVSDLEGKGEELDAGVKEELMAIKIEAEEKLKAFVELKARLVEIDAEISGLESSGGSQDTETHQAVAEVKVEKSEEIEKVQEAAKSPEEIAKEDQLSRDRELFSKMKQERIESRQKAGSEFQAAIDGLDIPEEWKKSVQESVTKEIIGDEKGEGHILSYLTAEEEMRSSSEDITKRFDSFDKIPQMWKALDSHIAELDDEQQKLKGDIQNIESGVVPFLKQPGIPYDRLPSELGNRMREEWNEALKKDKSYYAREESSKVQREHEREIRSALQTKKIRVDEIKRALKDEVDALKKNPKYYSASSAVARLHKETVEKL